MLRFNDCTFSAAGADRKAKTYGLNLTGSEDVLIENCVFNGTGYAAILNQTTGAVKVKGSTFECGNIYNPIEGTQTVAQGALTVEDCEFNGVPGNNFISFYNVADGSVHTIKKCAFHGATNNNIVRLSNKNNATAVFNIEDVKYNYVSGTADDYTGFILCQDYTNRSGVKQDFSKYTVNISNLNRPAEGVLFYVYEDDAGIISDNNPVVNNQ